MTKYINYWLKNMIKDTPNDMELGEKLREISWKQTKKQIVKDKNQPYIYERNPDTGEIFRRKLGDYSSPRELIHLIPQKRIKTTIITKKENSMSMMSLYDYLGRAAGPELGLKVAQAATKAQVKHEMREVVNPAYKGKVMLYPRAFLDLYFRNGLNENTSGKQLLKG
tara:strand:+ start:39 stop:539 length:501 start_codon:yes stop_codon:yes gene_type:complete